MDVKDETRKAYEHIVHRRKPNVFLGLIKSKLIADIGCGSGQNCAFLKEKGKDVICLDFSTKQLYESKKKGCENLILADMEFLPFRDSSMECLLYIASLHHLPNPSKALEEAWRSLKVNGEILATVWLIRPLTFKRNALLESKIENSVYRRFIHFYLPYELECRMKKAGFKKEKYALYRVKSLLPNNAFFLGVKT
ncbi:class I SAM-dependent methyltransferase [Candidatus Acidianus copahuensis]|uniref:Methyltransferase type 11 n=1 Tax=Candidatus Acidianus copahuensis TaxID=1160895 RepID=A0A031LW52_9CREN|nr:class I SAM-dependent methyltransferase [Candidatus Acidianus copahuensis]EZQ12036.1 methyltransferase type 11 [Candidatus Acidianus copahuensis]